MSQMHCDSEAGIAECACGDTPYTSVCSLPWAPADAMGCDIENGLHDFSYLKASRDCCCADTVLHHACIGHDPMTGQILHGPSRFRVVAFDE